MFICKNRAAVAYPGYAAGYPGYDPSAMQMQQYSQDPSMLQQTQPYAGFPAQYGVQQEVNPEEQVEEDPEDKKSQKLVQWGNTSTMNLENVLFTNIHDSEYFKSLLCVADLACITL